MSDKFCRLVFEDGRIVSYGPSALSINIEQIVQEDKKYGVFKPRNGKYFTFRVLDVNDKEIDDEFVNRAELLSFQSYTKRFNFDVKKAKPGEYADFRTIFRTPENDERKEMTNGTIMYHFFPIADYNNPNRGLCVVNPKFWFTSHGESLPMYIMDPDHYTKEDTVSRGPTIDYDAVTRHERGHGFGLPHDPAPNTTMSTPYPSIREFLDERTIFRMIKKYGLRKIQKMRDFTRFLKYIWHKSENY